MSGSWMIHRICIPLSFPQGVSPGASRDGNNLRIVRTADGTPIIRGSTWAGVLRAELGRRGLGHDQLVQWFGEALGSRHRGTPRLHHVVVHDCELSSVKDHAAPVVLRTHNSIDRHDGTVTDGGLFTVESAAPHSMCTLTLTVKSTGAPADEDQVAQLVCALAAAFADGVAVGGSKARGIGFAHVRDGAQISWQAFDLTNAAHHGQWLDVRAGRATEGGEDRSARIAEGGPTTQASTELTVDLVLRVPPGQDILCGDGRMGDLAVEVQNVDGADGKSYFRMPGSSLRGVFRGWFSRLAAKDGQRVAYSHEVALERRWRGDETAKVKPDDCVITQLFGSAHRAGRIHITDALTPYRPELRTERTHVRVDPLFATSVEGGLFSNAVLTSDAGPFKARVRITNPSRNEVDWLARTLRALHLGIIRIGSSKASGRVELAVTECAMVGPQSEHLKSELDSLAPSAATEGVSACR